MKPHVSRYLRSTSLLAMGVLVALGTPGTLPLSPDSGTAHAEAVLRGDLEKRGFEFSYDIDPRPAPEDWFGLGLIDLTIGENDPGHSPRESYAEGRVAGYIRGTTESGWHITASADTGEGPIEDMFRRLEEKDPEHVIERIRNSGIATHPTHGDDSTWRDDTPSSGRIYLEAEKDNTRLLWGDFRSTDTRSNLITTPRNLYGAQATHIRKDDEGPDFAIQGHAALPESLMQRDVLRGTGGSVYFLSHRDISQGSVQVDIRVANPDTGRVVSTIRLVEGEDYEVDPFQGVLLLTEPLSSRTGDSGAVITPDRADEIYLVVQYEYTPLGADINGSVLGGRAEVALGRRARIGITTAEDRTGAKTSRETATDIQVAFGTSSSAGFELARTEGPGGALSRSSDGGLVLTEDPVATGQADAVALEADIAYDDLGLGLDGDILLRYQNKEKGFRGLLGIAETDEETIEADTEIRLAERLSIGARVERTAREGVSEEDLGAVRGIYDLNPAWTATAEIERLDRNAPGEPGETGRRDDLALRLSYAPQDRFGIHGFGQATLDRAGGLTRNDRVGIGGSWQVTPKLAFSGEASDGSLGPLAEIDITYDLDGNGKRLAYTGFAQGADDATGEAAEQGTLVAGLRQEHSPRLSSFIETRNDLPGDRQASLRAYGLRFRTEADWSLSAAYETGDIRDDISGDFSRDALSLGAVKSVQEDWSLRARLECRVENGSGAEHDRETWGASVGFEKRTARDWTLLASGEALWSDSALDAFHDGEYVKASLGYAYRPLDHEKLNLVFHVTNLQDLPGEDQVASAGTEEGPRQKSTVFSIDASYDISANVTLGGKLAYRNSRVADRGTTDFDPDSAMLGISRADWHVSENWGLVAEGRIEKNFETETTQTGAIAGLYRDINEHVRAGLAYEWGRVSSDPLDLDYSPRGAHLNIAVRF